MRRIAGVWLGLVAALASCKKADAPMHHAVPGVLPSAAGASALALAPDETRLAVERCEGQGSCTVELQTPIGRSGPRAVGSLVGWAEDRLLVNRESMLVDDRGTTLAVPVAAGAILGGAACGGAWCALRSGGDLVAVRWADAHVAIIARGLDGDPEGGIAVDRERPMAYTVAGASLIAIDLESGAEAWRAALSGACERSTALVTPTLDGNAIVVTRARHSYDVLETCGLDAIDAHSGAVLWAGERRPYQITDVAAIGPSGVLFLVVRSPHAHSGGYHQWQGTETRHVDGRREEWRHEPTDVYEEFPRAMVVTRTGMILVALDDDR